MEKRFNARQGRDILLLPEEQMHMATKQRHTLPQDEVTFPNRPKQTVENPNRRLVSVNNSTSTAGWSVMDQVNAVIHAGEPGRDSAPSLVRPEWIQNAQVAEQHAKTQAPRSVDLETISASNPKLKPSDNSPHYVHSIADFSQDPSIMVASPTDDMSHSTGAKRTFVKQTRGAGTSGVDFPSATRPGLVGVSSLNTSRYGGKQVPATPEYRERLSWAERASVPELEAQATVRATNKLQSSPATEQAQATAAPISPMQLPTGMPAEPAKWTTADYHILHTAHRRGEGPAEAAVRLPKFTLEEVEKMWHRRITKKENRWKGMEERHAHEIQGCDQPDAQRLAVSQQGEEMRQTFRQNIQKNLKKRTGGL